MKFYKTVYNIDGDTIKEYTLKDLEKKFRKLANYHLINDLDFNQNKNKYSFIINNILHIFGLYKVDNNIDVLRGCVVKLIREWVMLKDSLYEFGEIYLVCGEGDINLFKNRIRFRDRLKNVLQDNINWMREHPIIEYLNNLEQTINGYSLDGKKNVDLRFKRMVNRKENKVKIFIVCTYLYPFNIELELVEDGFFYNDKFYANDNNHNFCQDLENAIIDWLSGNEYDEMNYEEE